MAPRLRVAALTATLVALGVPAAAAAATPVLHAHRGAVLDFGKPVSYEDTLPAFQRRAELTPGVWLEMDSSPSKDGVPYVIHDSTLDRTTDCSGTITELTSAQIDRCRVDKLGVSSNAPGTLVDAPATPVVRVPRLAEVLAFAKQADAPVNLEIKRIPGDPGYIPGDESFATAIMNVVHAAKLDPAKLIIQSFDPTNLDTAKKLLPGVQTAFLTLTNDPVTVAFTAARGYDWYSPSGPPSSALVSQAHALGVKVIPYTLDGAPDVRAATAAGVDAIITNDVALAQSALAGAKPASPANPGAGGGDPAPGAGSPPQGESAGPPAPRRALSFLNHLRAAVIRQGGLSVRLSGAKGTTARVRVSLRGRLVAGGTLRLARTGHKRLRLPLTAGGRRLLARAHGRVVLKATVTMGGNRASRSLRLR